MLKIQDSLKLKDKYFNNSSLFLMNLTRKGPKSVDFFVMVYKVVCQKSQKFVNIVFERSLVTFVKDSKDKVDSYALFRLSLKLSGTTYLDNDDQFGQTNCNYLFIL